MFSRHVKQPSTIVRAKCQGYLPTLKVTAGQTQSHGPSQPKGYHFAAENSIVDRDPGGWDSK